jgi:fumarate hydratase class II
MVRGACCLVREILCWVIEIFENYNYKPPIGYEKSALIAKTAMATGKPIGEVAESLGIMTCAELEALLVPDKLTRPI